MIESLPAQVNSTWKFITQTTIPYRGYRYTEEALPGSGERTFEGTGAEALAKAQEVRAAGRFRAEEKEYRSQPDTGGGALT